MIRVLIRLTLGAALAACGGSKSPDPAEPAPVAEPEPIDDTSPLEAPASEPAAQTSSETAPGGASAGPDLAAAERLAFEQARPVFEAHCARCHSKDGKKAKAKTLGHFDMTAYPFGGHHAGEVSAEVREVLGIGGGKATMPLDRPGAVKGAELDLVAAWADAFDKAHAAGAHSDRPQEHGGHGDHKH